jgi:hypothetical protein
VESKIMSKKMKKSKTALVTKGKKKIPINIIIHNPNNMDKFNDYYSSVIIDTIKKIA